MDIFKAKLEQQCGVGGLHCDCCNPTRYRKGYKKYMLNKKARSILKRELRQEISATIEP